MCCEISRHPRISSQLFLGLATPVAITIAGSHTYLATLSIRLPDPLTKEYFSWVGKMLRKGRVMLFGCAVAQVMTGSFVLHSMRKEWAHVNQKIGQELTESSPLVQEAARRGELKPLIRS